MFARSTHYDHSGQNKKKALVKIFPTLRNPKEIPSQRPVKLDSSKKQTKKGI